MALSVKFALLTCLLFTGGMCWVVNQVGRSSAAPDLNRVTANPERDAPEPPANHPPFSVTAERDLIRSGRLEQPSPVTRSQSRGTEPGIIVEAEASPEIAGDVRVPPPPVSHTLLEMRTAAEDSGDEFEVASGGPRRPDELPPAKEHAGAAEDRSKAAMHLESTGALQSSTVYTVKKGDSLYRVCREFYGDKQGDGIKLVLAENPKVAARSGKMLHLGEVLQIPPLEGANGMALDVGGMEAFDSQTVRVLPSPEIPEAVQEGSQPPEPLAPKLTQGTPRKSAPKKSPARTPAPREERPKARPSSPKPPPPATKLAMAKTTSQKPRGSGAADALRKSAGKPNGAKPNAKTAATRKNAAATPSKSAVEKRPANPTKKNARRASLQEVLEADPPATLAMVG